MKNWFTICIAEALRRNIPPRTAKQYERKLYMADKSKNEQYDIVALAEEVLRLYIKRYFDITRQMKAEKTRKRKQTRAALAVCGACLLLSADLLALTFLL